MDPDTQTSDDEHLESIPWSQLVVEAKGDRPMLIYVAAAAVLALAVGVVVARGMGGSPVVDVAPAPAITSTLEEPVVPEPISEADLRAPLLPTGAGERAVISRAEWFVADYFTADGAGDRQRLLEDALGWAPPELAGTPITYVEWSRAWDSLDLGDGHYRVMVAYRAISSADGAFTRGPVRGVAIPVQLASDGGARVVDLPSPVPLPSGPEPAAPAESGDVPSEVAASAREIARMWSDDVTVIRGGELAERWRVVVEVGIDSGRWPLVVWVEK